MCGTIDIGHTYDEYMVLLVKSGMTGPRPVSRLQDSTNTCKVGRNVVSDHTTIYRFLHLRLARAVNLSLAIGLIRQE
jgi:hypothetical protein